MKCAVNQCRNHDKSKKKKFRFYSFPKDEVLQQKWVNFCRKDKINANTARICCDHFRPEDLEAGFGKRNSIRLKPGTIPTIDTTTKTFEFINEELFDETLDMNMSTEVEEERILQGKSADYCSRAVQTGSCKSRTCGFVEVTLDNNIYTINCFYCGQEFTIWSWAKFVTHIKEQHNDLEDRFKDANDLYHDHVEPTSVENKKGVFIIGTQGDDVPVVATQKKTLVEIEKIKEEIIQNHEVVELVPEPNEFQACNTSAGETNAKNSALIKTEHLLSYSDFFSSSDDDEDDAPPPKETTATEIRFQKTSAPVTMDFLEVLKTYPILCSYQSKPSTDYSKALLEMTQNFNEKWNLDIAISGMRRSINRIKEWYRRVYASKKEDAGYKYKYKVYFGKCAEFLLKPGPPKPMPALPCDVCNNRYLTEIHLQVHKFERHNIGELPFKCRHCSAGLPSAERLQQHERTHNRQRDFICSVCSKSFYYESKLTAHMALHSEDRKIVCPTCGKKFLQPSRYRMHKVLHEPPKFKCHICSNAYYRRFRLKEHMNLHRNQRDNICDQCGKAFLRRRNLMVHKKTVHLRVMSSVCNICGEAFRFAGGLHVHRKTKHLVLEGTIEELTDKTLTGRTKHKYVIDPATNTKRVVCDVCGNMYRHITGLLVHKVNAHGHVRLKDKKKLKNRPEENDVDEMLNEEDDHEDDEHKDEDHNDEDKEDEDMEYEDMEDEDMEDEDKDKEDDNDEQFDAGEEDQYEGDLDTMMFENIISND